jgi:hypothetical protein
VICQREHGVKIHERDRAVMGEQKGLVERVRKWVERRKEAEKRKEMGVTRVRGEVAGMAEMSLPGSVGERLEGHTKRKRSMSEMGGEEKLMGLGHESG